MIVSVAYGTHWILQCLGWALRIFTFPLRRAVRRNYAWLNTALNETPRQFLRCTCNSRQRCYRNQPSEDMTEIELLLLGLASQIMSKYYISSGRNVHHCVIKGNSVTVCIFMRKSKPYEETGQRQRTRTHAVFKAISQVLRMSLLNVLDYALSPEFLEHSTLRTLLSNVSSNIRQRLAVCGIPRPLTPLQSAALLLTRNYTERDVGFIRRFSEA